MDNKMVETEARLFATRIAQQIAAEANTKAPDERAAFAGATASITLQNIVVSLLVSMMKPGDPEGDIFLKDFGDGFTKDSIERWHKPDLKERFGSNP